MKKIFLLIAFVITVLQASAQTITVTGAANSNLNKTYTLCNGCGFSYTTVEPKDAGTDSYFDVPASGLPFDQYQIYRKDGTWRFARVYMTTCCSPTTVPNLGSISSNTTKPPCDWGNGITMTGDCISSQNSCSVGPITFNTFCEGQTAYFYPGTPAGAPSFTYSWSGPNNFSSTDLNATRSNFSTADEGIYTITATGSNACTATASVMVNITDPPAQPGSFTSFTSLIDPGQSAFYAIPNVSNTSYIWAYSGLGANIESPSDSETYIDFSQNVTSGVLSISASNFCGVSPPRTLNITVQSPSVKSVTLIPNILSVPQLKSSEINGISTLEKGMLVFDTTLNCLKLYNGTAWVCLSTNL